jgi:hypothetical protein
MKLLTTTLGAVLLVGALSGTAFAAGASIDWDPIFTWEAGATPTNSPPGGILYGVGLVSSFEAPFADLNANDPSKEYTIYIYGLLSQGTVAQGPPATTFYITDYTGGFIEIYEGSPRNSSYDPFPPSATVPSTFVDGTLILAGSFTSFYTQTNNFTTFAVGNMEGTINWTGGTLLSRVNNGSGEPCPGLFTGGITWRPDVLIPGYIFRHDGKIDLNCPVGTEQGTWGQIKSMYGN